MLQANKIAVVGDIHGCYNELKKMYDILMSKGVATLYTTGDHFDRGPDNFKVLEFLKSTPNIIPIMGNHDQMLMDSFDAIDRDKHRGMYEDPFALWINNGGIDLFKEFMDDAEIYKEGYLNFQELEDNIEVLRPFYDFVIDLPYYYDFQFGAKRIIITHGGVNPPEGIHLDDYFKSTAYELDKFTAEGIMWNRVPIVDLPWNTYNFHGHTVTHRNKVLTKVSDRCSINFNVDTGCVFKESPVEGLGVLTAVIVDQDGEYEIVRVEYAT